MITHAGKRALKYSQYTPLLTHKSSVSGATPTPAKSEAPAAPIGGQAGQIPIGDALNEQPKEAAISGVPIQNVLSREEKVEYRDQDGNLLDEEQVKALEGKVEFKTKYETRTRVVDASGNEVQIPEGGWPQEQGGNVAPPHPDVQGVDPETKAKAEDSAVPKVAESVQGQKEAEQKKAKPASDGGKEATAQEEL
ncbi:dolichyl-phosphate-mannose-proteinmannosyltransferase [Colletotrichum higginsianum]|uniref:Dolichyl-phosphate-mannose-proteinmannosyltransfe rase n=1 Tax=Colletotrichum higginsianum (strain IMI 349063) TaxID=759273 RepID=H1W5F8_COLHI|nr:dolichyl-phosphate-mannose-proteinmannosyltransferase [Colletotrichum higginsianum]